MVALTLESCFKRSRLSILRAHEQGHIWNLLPHHSMTHMTLYKNGIPRLLGESEEPQQEEKEEAYLAHIPIVLIK